ncbi:MAG: ATP-dependent DNA helicase II subunit 2 [Icmadophila ericetorum]|nr:ATP-dependent DNA helicase II subunit 2 [Icmadophila ericetorum]
MADKEATVYVVDVGKSMGQKNHGRQQTDLEWAMTYIWDNIANTVATERKTALAAVLGLRTDGDEDAYKNISVIQDISQILLPDLRRIQQHIKPSKTNNGDAISAIVIAIQMIAAYCKKLKYRRKIVLVTNGHGTLDGDESDSITKKIKEDGIELVIIGVDFDDAEYGFKEEDKDTGKRNNEKILKGLVEDCGGVFGTLAQAVEELQIPKTKLTRPVHSYKGELTLGDSTQYETVLSIDVERYPRTSARRPPTASTFAVKTNQQNGGASHQSSATLRIDEDDPEADPGLSSVRNNRVYKVSDDTAPGGKRDVNQDELAKGYEYGRTAVHISEADESVTKLETEAALEIVGFIPCPNYERYMSLSVSQMVIGQKGNAKASMALSSLIHALRETDSYLVARLVPKQNKNPVMLLLAPSIEAQGYECLVDVQLPFAEDVRSYKFPPLDKVLTISGKVLKEHRNLPSKSLADAMSDYVDCMDISQSATDEDGNPIEHMAMDDVYSPVLHRINQAIRWKAVFPDEPVPPPYEFIAQSMRIPDTVRENGHGPLKKLAAVSDVKKVPPKLTGKRRNRDAVKPLSGLNIEAILGNSSKRAKISTDNPIPEFKRMMANAEDITTIQDAAKQLGDIIESQVRSSFGAIKYGQAIEELTVMREELIEMEEPGLYNDFIRRFKKKLLKEELGGDRRELWFMVRRDKLGLVEKKVAPQSDIMEEEASDFLRPKL